jgi:predicted permease
MELALILLTKIGHMFVMIAIGFISAKVKLITKETSKKLSDILLYLVNPLLIFTSFQMEFNKDLFKNQMIAFGLSFASMGAAILLSYVFIRKKNNPNCSIERFALIFPNCSFMGIPLLSSLFGNLGVFYLTAYIAVFNIFVWTYGVIMISGKTSLKDVAKQLLSPAIIAIVLGIICFVTRFSIPDIILEPLNTVGGMNTPLAMLIAGVALAHSDFKRALTSIKTYYLIVLRLLIIPAIFILAVFALPIDSTLLLTVIIAASCPTATITTMFALKYDKDTSLASNIFATTTLLCLFTIPLLVLFAGFLGVG